jgi:hypothetical protein
MDNFDRAQRDWENPPDEDEAEICEFCGEEMEYKEDYGGEEYTICRNMYCPQIFTKILNTVQVVDMANHLVEVEQSLKDTQNTLKYVRRKLAWTDELLAEREATIEKLEKKITALEFHRDEGE